MTLNALRSGKRSKDLPKLLERLGGPAWREYLALRDSLTLAMLPETPEQLLWVARAASRVWVVRRAAERYLRTPEMAAKVRSGYRLRTLRWRIRRTGSPDPAHLQAGVGSPVPAQLQAGRMATGWKVTVSIWARRPRGRDGYWIACPGRGLLPGRSGWPQGAISITVDSRHPLAEVQGWPAVWNGMRIRTKRESPDKSTARELALLNADSLSDPAVCEGE